MANGVPQYIQDTGKDLAAQMTKTYSTPVQTGAFTPQVAAQDPMQTQAIGMATAGIDSYKPYLTAAQTAMGQAGTAVGGLGALTGAQAYQPFMSPYQTDVIDETLRQYDLSRTGGRQSIQDAAVASGNFGGGREGAYLGQYDADSLANRAGIRAGLLQQGFGQAQQQAQQAFQNQQQMANMYAGLGTQQMGLSNFERAGMGQDIAAMGQMGAGQQAYEQAKLNRDAQAAQMQAYEPYGRLSQYASGIAQLTPGAMAAGQYAQQPQRDPWGSALSTAMGLGGLYGQIFNPTPWSRT
tara:strand:- start:1369 stop:2253 length:885 start_codon:yes stop_codon:yes gene_type:complete